MVRDIISNDVYRPHTFEEVEALITPEVAARLDPQQNYGLWTWGTNRHVRTQVSEVGPDGQRIYRKRHKRIARPKEEWLYVPVPDSGVPRAWVDAARETIKDNRKSSNAGRRFWELSGGILRCGECGWTLHAHTVPSRSGKRLFYYNCKAKYKHGPDFCQATRTHSAEKLEARVWDEIRSYLEEPERLRADLTRKIELEKSSARGEPEQEIKMWAEKLQEADSKRVRFQHAYAEGIFGLEDLKARLAELDDDRATAEREIAALEGRMERVRSLEEDRDAVLADHEAMAPKVLDCLDSEERHRFYKMLRLRVRIWPDRSLEITGAFPEPLKVGAEVCTSDGSRSTNRGAIIPARACRLMHPATHAGLRLCWRSRSASSGGRSELIGTWSAKGTLRDARTFECSNNPRHQFPRATEHARRGDGRGELRRLRAFLISRGGGTRTHTTLRPPDFKSGASADSATPPGVRSRV